jgi:3D (Asp-Asp-Asp) domain-containing protein
VLRPSRLFILAAALLLAGCATERPLPAWEKPLARTEFQTVRTTAYFDGEADHLRYTNHNALGTCLQHGQINSAAADWARWPAGTMFRILQNGRTYVVDDYGWDLAGTNTIDIYQPSRSLMDDWGVRRVDIQILQWGDPALSYNTLEPRSGYRHVARMLAELRPELNRFPVEQGTIPAAIQPQPEYQNQYATQFITQPVAATTAPRPASRPSSYYNSNGVALTPFY